MGKIKSGFSLNILLVIFLLVAAVIGVFVSLKASQTQTQTESKAAEPDSSNVSIPNFGFENWSGEADPFHGQVPDSWRSGGSIYKGVPSTDSMQGKYSARIKGVLISKERFKLDPGTYILNIQAKKSPEGSNIGYLSLRGYDSAISGQVKIIAQTKIEPTNNWTKYSTGIFSITSSNPFKWYEIYLGTPQVDFSPSILFDRVVLRKLQ